MKSGRFFVTYVTILATAAVLAALAPATGVSLSVHQTEVERKAALVQEGNAKIHDSLVLQAELKEKFEIAIRTEIKGKHRSLETEKFHWSRLSKEDRREIRAKLAQYLQLVNRVLEIDAQKNITVENRDQIVNSRESAEAFQRSLENFERVNGANFKSKRNSAKPA